jgi:hypothetical protein
VSLFSVVALIVIGTTIWVGFDASKRDWTGRSGTATYVVGCILLWIVCFPWYLSVRNKVPLKGQGQGAVTTAPHGIPAEAMYRECPFCKEAMRRDASHCPHCRQESTPWRLHDGHWWFRESEEEPWEWLDENTGE